MHFFYLFLFKNHFWLIFFLFAEISLSTRGPLYTCLVLKDINLSFRRIYWSDWGSKPKIEVADLDGDNRKALIQENLGWPNSIALDYQRRYLYWADAKLHRVDYLDLRQNKRHTIAMKTTGFGVSVMGDFVFWTDAIRRSLHKYDMMSRRSKTVSVLYYYYFVLFRICLIVTNHLFHFLSNSAVLFNAKFQMNFYHHKIVLNVSKAYIIIH